MVTAFTVFDLLRENQQGGSGRGEKIIIPQTSRLGLKEYLANGKWAQNTE